MAEDEDALPMAADGDAYTYESSDPYITIMPQNREDVDQNAVAALERMAFTDFGYGRANTMYFYAKTVDYSSLQSLTFKLLMDVPQGMDDLHLFVYGFNNNQSMGTHMGLSVESDGVSVTIDGKTYEIRDDGGERSVIERLEGTPTAGGIRVALKSLSPIYVAKIPQKDLIRHGDINGDGLVNLADAIRLLKYLVDNSTDKAYSGNVNSSEDGKVNAADLIHLMRYLNGEDVSIY